MLFRVTLIKKVETVVLIEAGSASEIKKKAKDPEYIEDIWHDGHDNYVNTSLRKVEAA